MMCIAYQHDKGVGGHPPAPQGNFHHLHGEFPPPGPPTKINNCIVIWGHSAAKDDTFFSVSVRNVAF
jgi:hypothetical protein